MDEYGVRRTLTDAMLGRRQSYRLSKNKKVLPFNIYLREQLANAHAFGAKKYGITGVKFKNKFYTLNYHDGTQFKNKVILKQCLYPSTAYGDQGCQGNGGTLSGLLLVMRNEDYEHIVFSKFADGTEHAYRAKIDDRTPIVEQADEVIPFLKKIIDTKDFPWSDVNVCYMTRYEKVGGDTLHDIVVMSHLSDFAASSFDGAMQVYFNNGFVITGEECDEAVKKHFSTLSKSRSHTYPGAAPGGNYANIQVASYEDYVSKFCDKSFEYYFKDCKMTFQGQSVVIGGTLKIDVFPGLARSRNSGNGLIPIRNSDGKAVHQFQPMDLSTSLTLNCFKDSASIRLCKDPVYWGNLNSHISSLMRINVPGYLHKYEDIGNFDELKFCAGTDATRFPFVRFRFDIDSLKLEEGNTYSPTELRNNLLGGIDEFFMAQDCEKCIKIIDHIAKNVEENNNLSVLRKCVNKWFPTDFSDLAPLKTNYGKICRKVKFIQNGKQNKINPGMYLKGTLQYEDGTPVTKDSKIIPSNKGFDIIRCGDENDWILDVVDFSVLKENGSIKKITKDEWLITDKRVRLPRQRNLISINGSQYDLWPRFNIPKTGKINNPGHPNKHLGKQLHDSRSKDMYLPMGDNQDLYVKYIPKSGVLLNSDNVIVNIHFKKIPEFQKWRDRLWKDIEKACLENWNIIDNIKMRWRDGREALEEKWKGDTGPVDYMLNRLISHIFTSDEAKHYEIKIKEHIDIAADIEYCF